MPVFQSANFLCTTTGLKNSAWPGTACYIHLISLCAYAISGFPIWVLLVGDILGKMAKNCMKITKSTFFAQNREGTWGQANCLGSAGGIPPQSSPTSGNPASYSWTQSDIFNCKYLVEKYFFWKISTW